MMLDRNAPSRRWSSSPLQQALGLLVFVLIAFPECNSFVLPDKTWMIPGPKDLEEPSYVPERDGPVHSHMQAVHSLVLDNQKEDAVLNDLSLVNLGKGTDMDDEEMVPLVHRRGRSFSVLDELPDVMEHHEPKQKSPEQHKPAAPVHKKEHTVHDKNRLSPSKLPIEMAHLFVTHAPKSRPNLEHRMTEKPTVPKNAKAAVTNNKMAAMTTATPKVAQTTVAKATTIAPSASTMAASPAKTASPTAAPATEAKNTVKATLPKAMEDTKHNRPEKVSKTVSQTDDDDEEETDDEEEDSAKTAGKPALAATGGHAVMQQPRMIMQQPIAVQPRMIMPQQVAVQPRMVMPQHVAVQPRMVMPQQVAVQPRMVMPQQVAVQPRMVMPQPMVMQQMARANINSGGYHG